ncbi:Metallo-beta-lactamase superfamily protein [Flavobacteriaceae bacterium MAR_2010_188]|nr:Metallo-beta-lactamase superfamily protein [Flavobacteriaceae bacterium MAR_2010_188]
MKTQLSIIILAFLSIVSCKNDKANIEQDTVVEENVEVEEPQLKLYTLDGGTVQVNKLEVFSQGDRYKGESREFADPIYVIEHPKGRILWDAGLAEGLVGQEPFTTPDGAFTVSRKDSIESQLQTLNLTPADFDYLILSHTHFDHSGSAAKFKDATWIVQEKEYDFVTSEENQKNDPDTFNAIKGLTKIQKINGDYDVYGDGKVVIKFTPGHTAGHQSLFLDLDEEGPIILSGDLYHFEENRTDRVVPSFNYSVDETLNSMNAFEAFANEKNAKVYIQHSTKDFNAMPKAPKPLQ